MPRPQSPAKRLVFFACSLALAAGQQYRLSITPFHRFDTSIIRAERQQALDGKEIRLRLLAAFPEADELIQIQDDYADFACPFHFVLGTVGPIVWKKALRPREGPDDVELRTYSNDVQDRADLAEISQLPGDIKIVGRIEYCEGKGRAPLHYTNFNGCALENGTFLIASGALSDSYLRGQVIAHEYGHNVCLEDSKILNEIMFGDWTGHPERQRSVSQDQCRHYLAPKGRLCSQAPSVRRSR